MIAALSEIPAGDVVLLHGCCHNPTGVDPTAIQWRQIADVVSRQGLLPFVDFAYQGLARGFAKMRPAWPRSPRTGCDLLVASSFSKNFGLYSERVGALTAVCRTPAAAEAVLSQLKACIPHQLLESARARGRDRDHNPRRSATARAVGERSPRHPRANQRHAKPVRANARGSRREAGLFVRGPAARHVFVLRLEPRASRPSAR